MFTGCGINNGISGTWKIYTTLLLAGWLFIIRFKYYQIFIPIFVRYH